MLEKLKNHTAEANMTNQFDPSRSAMKEMNDQSLSSSYKSVCDYIESAYESIVNYLRGDANQETDTSGTGLLKDALHDLPASQYLEVMVTAGSVATVLATIGVRYARLEENISARLEQRGWNKNLAKFAGSCVEVFLVQRANMRTACFAAVRMEEGGINQDHMGMLQANYDKVLLSGAIIYLTILVIEPLFRQFNARYNEQRQEDDQRPHRD